MAQTCSICGSSNRNTARFCQQCATPLQGGAAPFGAATGLLSPQSKLSDRYLILKKVGQGGMAAVYQAADTRIGGKLWAVKEMSNAAITNPLERQEAQNAFKREAETLSRLTHPNIPRVTDFFSEAGKHYLVMEFVTGETLEEILERHHHSLPEGRVRDLAEQLCDVLGYLHTQKPSIVFRDLKPGNIMIDQDGSVKLIDFGIIRFFQPGKTKDTTTFGTAGYAPPEQYGKGQTDGRSDIYALGATLHHLLTHRDPALTPFRFESVRRLNPAVSLAMELAIMRAVEQDPARRWQNVWDMKQAIVSAASGPSYGYSTGAQSKPALPVAAENVSAPVSIPPPVKRQVPVYNSVYNNIVFASFGRRMVAYIIDAFIVSIPHFVFSMMIAMAMESVRGDQDLQDALALFNCGWLLLYLLFTAWYYVVLPARSGQTGGKRMLGIKIVATNGGSPGVGRCLLRWIGYLFSAMILYLGFLMPLWTEKRQALHDMMASTYVVRA